MASRPGGVGVVGALADAQDVQSQLHDGLTLTVLTEGTRVQLSLNTVSFHEGLWQVALLGADGTRIYSIGFGLTEEHTLTVGNVQGPSIHVVDGPGRIRDVTREAHGMRPAHFLMHVLRMLAPSWQIASLQGVDPENHVKGRWNLRDSRLRFDDRAFWEEHGAVRHANGNGSLAARNELRPLEDIASTRRAMYRRRYAMFDAIQEMIRGRIDLPAI